MKAAKRLGYRTSHQRGTSISLFPFLAVLICTMGALVPLLLAITRTAKMQAEAAAVAKLAEKNEEIKTQREDVRWRIEQLKKSREQTEAQLADARLELGHLEDHSRRLREKLSQFERTVKELQHLENADQQKLSQSHAELEDLRRRIVDLRRQVTEIKEAKKTTNRSYAVVPYEGPNQTKRRPIYLECREDAVVLQPEGIVLTESDFEGPLGPGNPLAASLRAAREYLLSQRDFDPQLGEPYPLLLVRPSGIAAYYAARAAMKSWGFEFGYELIEDSWKLTYPPADPRLADLLRQTVAAARIEQARLIAAAPRHYRAGAKSTTYRASPTRGGFVPEDNMADDGASGYVPARVGGHVGQNAGHFSPKGSSAGSADNPDYNPYVAATEGQPTTTLSAGAVAGNTPGGTKNKSNAGIIPDGKYGSGTYADGATSGYAAPQGQSGLPGTTAMASNSSGATPGQAASERPEGYIVGQPAREQVNKAPVSSGDEQQLVRGRMLRPGEWEPSPEMPKDLPKDKNKDEDEQDKACRRPPPKSLAEIRGENWGLRDAARGAVGITRPINIECHADRLVVISDRNPADNKVVPLGPRIESSVDTFISAVWEHMERWGIAGRGMYWRPILNVYVAPGAEHRYEELTAILAGSGFTVVRKK